MKDAELLRRTSTTLTKYEPDVLAKGLDVVFCGLNPASSAVVDGHSFSNRSNRFWLVLHLAGFTDMRLEPQDERRLLNYGCGITAVAPRATKRADEIPAEEFRQARHAFEAKMRHYAPRALAFLGKRALSAMIGRPHVDWGRQPTGFAGRWPGFFPIRVGSTGASRSMRWSVPIRNSGLR